MAPNVCDQHIFHFNILKMYRQTILLWSAKLIPPQTKVKGKQVKIFVTNTTTIFPGDTSWRLGLLLITSASLIPSVQWIKRSYCFPPGNTSHPQTSLSLPLPTCYLHKRLQALTHQNQTQGPPCQWDPCRVPFLTKRHPLWIYPPGPGSTSWAYPHPPHWLALRRVLWIDLLEHLGVFHSWTCHSCSLLFFLVWKLLSRVWLFVTLWTVQSMKFSKPEYWVGSLSLLQGIFPTQGSNPGLLHCRWILHQLSHKGSPFFLGHTHLPRGPLNSPPNLWDCCPGFHYPQPSQIPFPNINLMELLPDWKSSVTSLCPEHEEDPISTLAGGGACTTIPPSAPWCPPRALATLALQQWPPSWLSTFSPLHPPLRTYQYLRLAY